MRTCKVLVLPLKLSVPSAYSFALQNHISGRGFPSLKLWNQSIGSSLGYSSFWNQAEGCGYSQSASRKMKMFPSLIPFWEPTSLGILCWLKTLAVFWRNWDGMPWLTQPALMSALAGPGGLPTPNAHFRPLFCYCLIWGSCAVRWSAPQSSRMLTKEGRREREGEGHRKEEVQEWEWEWEWERKKLLWVRSTFAVDLSNNLRLELRWREWSDLSYPLSFMYFHCFMYFFMYLISFSAEMHSSNIFILFSHQLCCTSLNLPSLVLLCSLWDWVLRVAHRVPGERERARSIRAPLIVFR